MWVRVCAWLKKRLDINNLHLPLKHPAASPQTLSIVVGIVFYKYSVGGSVCLAAVNPPTCLPLPSEHPTVSRLPLPESPTVATSRSSRRVSSSGAAGRRTSGAEPTSSVPERQFSPVQQIVHHCEEGKSHRQPPTVSFTKLCGKS